MKGWAHGVGKEPGRPQSRFGGTANLSRMFREYVRICVRLSANVAPPPGARRARLECACPARAPALARAAPKCRSNTGCC
ncbi:response regulator protein [Burkholderia pseudomallei Pakistan 9]|nr:response regulator protein [Burkholderia pseudomallei Pakistan 9]